MLSILEKGIKLQSSLYNYKQHNHTSQNKGFHKEIPISQLYTLHASSGPKLWYQFISLPFTLLLICKYNEWIFWWMISLLSHISNMGGKLQNLMESSDFFSPKFRKGICFLSQSRFLFWSWWCSSSIEHLPSIFEALGLIHSTTKKIKTLLFLVG